MCDCAMVCNAGVTWQGAGLTAGDAAREAFVTAEAARAPHVLMRPHLAKDGNMWSFLYGDNIQEGVCGFGETVEAAAADFDKNWRTEKILVAADRQPLTATERETIRQKVESMRSQIESQAKTS